MASADHLQLFVANGQNVEPKTSPLPGSGVAAQKEGYRYFMEKEIYEQDAVVASILSGRRGS